MALSRGLGLAPSGVFDVLLDTFESDEFDYFDLLNEAPEILADLLHDEYVRERIARCIRELCPEHANPPNG